MRAEKEKASVKVEPGHQTCEQRQSGFDWMEWTLFSSDSFNTQTGVCLLPRSPWTWHTNIKTRTPTLSWATSTGVTV